MTTNASRGKESSTQSAVVSKTVDYNLTQLNCGCDGGIGVVEVQKVDNILRLIKRSALAAMDEEERTNMFYNDKCLQMQGALDTKSVLD